MKFLAYWNGNIPAISELFFSSFLATQTGNLELYLENCNNLKDISFLFKNSRVEIKEIKLEYLSKGTIFEKFFPSREQNYFDTLIIQAYNKYFTLKSQMYKKVFLDRLPRHPSRLRHPVMGLTATSKSIIEIPFYGSVKEQYKLSYWGDIFRLLMCVKEKDSFVYTDLDVCFLKDFTSLYEQGDFVYEWEHQKFANSAILFSSDKGILKKNISALVEKYDTVVPWFIFSKTEPLIKELKILPCEIFDPLWKQKNCIGFDSFFKDDLVMDMLNNSYAYHWHNHWKTKPKKGSCYDILVNKFKFALQHS
ncbi:hypothetical protein IQ276_037865 [Desmonostoc muscorum LEGE 12446]|uniref:Uncharacterized protein n=1 Tax=Desmonostoc muscorum LEGE 12446 TaxID=1828758 RepID=A0A8J7CYR8_DESMC|nr:hypothetical protein [Desmonostoc muscorum]MCF2152069.1 hypothetical protein [Desmonostoc muscorum LEGE 12446]